MKVIKYNTNNNRGNRNFITEVGYAENRKKSRIQPENKFMLKNKKYILPTVLFPFCIQVNLIYYAH